MGSVDSGLELESVLLGVDFPEFDDSLGLVGDGVFDTASAGEEVALKSEYLGISVESGMLFIGDEYVFVEEIVIIEIAGSVKE